MSSLGNKTFKVTAIDSSGNMTTKEIAYTVNSVDVTTTMPTSTVDPMMELRLPASTPAFEPFVPGVAREYLIAAAPQVTTTAGDTSLSIWDAATTGTGRLVNGTATLTNALQAYATATQGTAGAGGNVGGAAAPTPLISFAAPQTNRTVNLTFRQNITATETLRSGSYGKTLTFTLSTTAP